MPELVLLTAFFLRWFLGACRLQLQWLQQALMTVVGSSTNLLLQCVLDEVLTCCLMLQAEQQGFTVMEYNASAVNAEEGPPLKLLNDSLLCINLLRVPTRTLHQLREGTNIERNQLGKQLVTRVEHLVQHPPQQHTATGRPSNHLFKVLNTIGSQSRSTVVAVRHMTYRDNTDNMYEPEHSIRRHVLKVFPFNSPEDVQYDAQQVAVSKMGISDGKGCLFSHRAFRNSISVTGTYGGQ